MTSRFRAHLIGAAALMVLAIWLSSGTMAPYASTWPFPIVSEPCGYLYNIDHPHHEGVFQMLDGQPSERWRNSVVLRRILFPLVAYPLMKVAGYERGGFVASLLVHVAALLALGLHLRRRHGERTAVAGVWLLAVYPGITYWAALPYAYAAIVPASIGLFILLTALDERTGLRAAAAISAAMGLLFTAYDLAPFFGVAAIALLVRRRRFVELPVALAAMASGPVLTALVLRFGFHAPLDNPNTAIYRIVLGAYFHPPALGVWLRAVADFPVVLVVNFFCSNMVALPALFLMAAVITRQRPTLVEGTLLASTLLLFLFNNLAPPYEGKWQMRGDYIPRLYQPVFVALLVYVARALGQAGELPRPKRVMLGAVTVFAVLASASVAFGPVARIPWAGPIYHRFYMHAGAGTMDYMLGIHGRRPLGFCRRS